MNTRYRATYYDAACQMYGADVFLSDVVITIRYLRFGDEKSLEKEICWPTKDTVFWQQTIMSELQYKNDNGQVQRLAFMDVEFIQAIKKIPITPGYIPGNL